MTAESKARASLAKVPRPKMYQWGVNLSVAGLAIAVFGFFWLADAQNCFVYCDDSSIALATSVFNFGIALGALGWPMLLLGLLIHAIRIEGAATRLGIVSPYEEERVQLPPAN